MTIMVLTIQFAYIAMIFVILKKRRINMDKNSKEKHGCLLVSFDFEDGDVHTVLVGYKSKNKKR